MSVWRAYKKHSATSHSARVASHFTSYYYNDLLPSINDARTVAKYTMRDICDEYRCRVEITHGETAVNLLKKLLPNFVIESTGHKSNVFPGLKGDMPSSCDVLHNMMPDAVVYARNNKIMFCAEEASTEPSSDIRNHATMPAFCAAISVVMAIQIPEYVLCFPKAMTQNGLFLLLLALGVMNKCNFYMTLNQ